MKKIYLFFLLMFIIVTIKAQELIVDGDMTSEDYWIGFWRSDAADEGTYEFNFKTDKPFAGTGGCLEVYGFGQTGLLIFQPVTLTPGHNYFFDGAFKGVSPQPLSATWVELILSSKKPDDEGKGDYTAGNGDYIYAMNSWMADPFKTMDVDGTFSETFRFTWNKGSSKGADTLLTGSNVIFIPDTITNTTWYVSFKAGCWAAAAGDESAPFDFLVDNISLIDLGVLNGNNQLSLREKLFSISPNPSNGIIALNPVKSTTLNYQIIDFSGRVILSGKSIGKSTLNLNNLQKGIYLVSVTNGSNTESQKFILK